ncbi:MAG: tetratricopeptide repeat protein [Propionicimonas sp.]
MRDLTRALVELRRWAGNPSYADLAEAVGELRDRQHRSGGRPGKTTVYDCFRPGRRRLDAELFRDLVAVLGVPARAQEQWWQAYRLAADRRDDDTALPRHAEELALWAPRTRLLGRDRELAELIARPPGSVTQIVGAPGTGKTELALHLTARWRQLLGATTLGLALDLRGYDPELEPLPPASVLARLLQGAGVPPSGYEDLDVGARVVLLRRVVADRPAVVLLDNAGSSSQLLPLLPVPPRWRIVITSRRRYAEVADAAGAAVVLGELHQQAALQLLATGVGSVRVAAEPEAAARIVTRCGGIALDLTLVGAAIAAESEEWTLADHAARLEALPADELLRPALQLSYAALSEPVRRVLRLSALHPGPRITVAEVAALAGCSRAAVVSHLDRLVAEHLLTAVEAGFTMHDVVRAFALRQLVLSDPRSQQLRAVGRWIRQLGDEVRHHSPPGRPDTGWLTDRLPVVVALVDGFADTALVADIAELVVPVIECLDVAGQLAEAESLLRAVLNNSTVPNRSTLRRKLGRILELRGDLGGAWEELRGALDPQDAEYGRALNGVGNVLKRMGRSAEAVHYYRLAARQAELSKDCFAQGRALGNLADALRELGHLEIAERLFDVARRCSMDADDQVNLAIMLSNYCELVEERGDFDRAVQSVLQALPTFTELGFAALWVNAEGVRARCLLATGDLDGCEAALARAERQAELSGIPEQRCDLAMIRGRLLMARGEEQRAVAELRGVVASAQRLGLLGKATQAQMLLDTVTP